MDKLIKQGERLDDLNLDGLCVIQNANGYCFTSDSVLLANFINAGHKDNCIELCAGCGVVSVIMGHKRKPQCITMVEIQSEQVDRIKRTFDYNKMNANIICSPLQGIHKTLGFGKFDVCYFNPPYEKSAKISSINEEIAVSTHEIKVNLREIVEESAKLLKFGGKLFMVYPTNRLAELLYELKIQNIEPKKMTIIHPKATKNAELALIYAVKGAKPGLVVTPPLVERDDNNKQTEQMNAIYDSR